MLNRSASLAMSTSVLEALPGKLDIKRREPGILYFLAVVWLSVFCLLLDVPWVGLQSVIVAFSGHAYWRYIF